ncbi:hypothetical protein BDZ91DRAFT_504578 [Kalaharituber pfeilii]|nr:hypothetical protein BDZ91DRAFT_504578 [Kalaharituber pfeilii]
MLSNVFYIYFLVLVTRTLCVLATAEAGLAATTSPRAIVLTETETEGWRTLFKKNVLEMLAPRQENEGGNNSSDNGPLKLDMASWDVETTAKCMDKLRAMSKASNPAGLAVCYNVPAFNRTNWVLLADLRLYKISAPDQQWESVGSDIQVELNFPGAAVEERFFGTPNPTDSTDGPQFIKGFHFIGAVRDNFRKEDASDVELKEVLSPEISISATKSDGTELRANLSTTEAGFLNGVLSNAEVAPTPSSTPSPVAVEPSIPGKQIEIMPIGLIFYSTYMFIGVSVVMYGTFERRKFRDQYRQRIAQNAPGPTRI